MKPQLPEELTKPLIFGDVDQINAIKSYEAKCLEYYGDGTKKKFSVFVECSFSRTVEVEAYTAREAENKVESDFHVSACDLDIDFYADGQDEN